MKRDCPTSKMSRIDLHHLLDASAAPERQMETIRMPALEVRQLTTAPEAGLGDVTLIGVICMLSMTLCGALASL